jgi:hypothetical protein
VTLGTRLRVLLLAVTLAACGARPEPEPVPPPAPAPPSAKPEGPAPPPPVEAPPATPVARLPLQLAFVGDINLGTSTLPDGIPPDSGRGLLGAARPFLRGDLVIGNLEGVLADTGTSEKCLADTATTNQRRASRSARLPPRPVRSRPGCYAFLTPTHLAPRLHEAGFTHLGLANNHAHDYGLAGRTSTEQTLDSLGIRWYGPLGRVVVDTLQRGDSMAVVGLIGFATYPHSYDLLDIPRSVAVVDSVRGLADVVLVTFHGGTEGAAATRVGPGPEFLGREPRGDLRTWAHAVVDAGADLVVGHGPHVLRGMEWYRGRLIAYSLGNFATYRGFSVAGPLGVTGVLQVRLGPDGRLSEARLVSMQQAPRRGPAPDESALAITMINELSAQDFGADAVRLDGDGRVLPPLNR